MARLHDGVSMFATLGQALGKAQSDPMLGRFIAERSIPISSEARVERTIRRSRGHHTIWSVPESLLRCEIGVVPVPEGN